MESSKQTAQGHQADSTNKRPQDKQPQQGQHEQHQAGKQAQQSASKKPDDTNQSHDKQPQTGQQVGSQDKAHHNSRQGKSTGGQQGGSH